MEAIAIEKNVRISPQKARLVADEIRGLPVARALEVLGFSRKKAARPLRKALESAIANAENNFGADVDALRVSAVMVDGAATLRRFAARAKGRGTRIVKRNSHCTVMVSDQKAAKRAKG